MPLINKKCLALHSLVAVCAAFMLPAHGASVAQVEGVRFGDRPDGTRIVLDLTRPASHRVFTLKDPDRVVVDLFDTRAASGVFDTSAGRGAVSQVRVAPRDGDDLRVVFDLSSAAEPSSRIFAISDAGPRNDAMTRVG